MRPHERLIWADRPIVSVRRLPALGRIVFGLIFGGFAVFWTSAAWLMSRGTDDIFFGMFFPLFGLPFIVVGAGIVVTGVKSWRERGGTVYALTDQRLLIISTRSRRTVRSVDLKAIRGVERRDGTGGVGTITLLVGDEDTRNEILPASPKRPVSAPRSSACGRWRPRRRRRRPRAKAERPGCPTRNPDRCAIRPQCGACRLSRRRPAPASRRPSHARSPSSSRWPSFAGRPA